MSYQRGDKGTEKSNTCSAGKYQEQNRNKLAPLFQLSFNIEKEACIRRATRIQSRDKYFSVVLVERLQIRTVFVISQESNSRTNTEINFPFKHLLLGKACSCDPTWVASDMLDFVQQWGTMQKLHQQHHHHCRGEVTCYFSASQDHLLLLATSSWQGLKNLRERKKSLVKKSFSKLFFPPLISK